MDGEVHRLPILLILNDGFISEFNMITVAYEIRKVLDCDADVARRKKNHVCKHLRLTRSIAGKGSSYNASQLIKKQRQAC